ncbi:hypothetical protein [Acetobacter ascendens]|uniref:Phage tail assembly chaperone n=1 Tax=Acetobacter ascendens TaxID=481146 RepID=A0A1Y0UVP4_9PROT|nr:hypothetical protein [Acetobacter ascendens]ARW09981.1 hypothetical protein S101447_00879 [Acetobacter ascendens]
MTKEKTSKDKLPKIAGFSWEEGPAKYKIGGKKPSCITVKFEEDKKGREIQFLKSIPLSLRVRALDMWGNIQNDDVSFAVMMAVSVVDLDGEPEMTPESKSEICDLLDKIGNIGQQAYMRALVEDIAGGQAKTQEAPEEKLGNS